MATPHPNRISIWTAPATVLLHFAASVADAARAAARQLLARRHAVALIAIAALAASAAYNIDGAHQQAIARFESLVVWYSWWIGLGIASSIGLGTGLHTFMLFLSPFIAETTLAAYSCQSIHFNTRGPDRFVCPLNATSALNADPVTIWSIWTKIRLETFFWGLGTAIGELPPYFVARAAMMAGKDDPEFASIESILAKSPSSRNISERAQVFMHSIVTKLGFFGILLCASVPNPLFDLAGIICGHFAIPFLTFFGATLIGKSFIKSSLQSFAIVVIFSQDVRLALLSRLEQLWPSLHAVVEQIIDDQVSKFKHGNQKSHTTSEKVSIFSILWSTFMVLMVLYFVISIIESLAVARIKAISTRSAAAAANTNTTTASVSAGTPKARVGDSLDIRSIAKQKKN